MLARPKPPEMEGSVPSRSGGRKVQQHRFIGALSGGRVIEADQFRKPHRRPGVPSSALPRFYYAPVEQ